MCVQAREIGGCLKWVLCTRVQATRQGGLEGNQYAKHREWDLSFQLGGKAKSWHSAGQEPSPAPAKDWFDKPVAFDSATFDALCPLLYIVR
jgi:hypothetical protein